MDRNMSKNEKIQTKQWSVYLLSLALVVAFTGELAFSVRLALVLIHSAIFFVSERLHRKIPAFFCLFLLLSIPFFILMKESLLGAFVVVKNANLVSLSYLKGQIYTTMVVPNYSYITLAVFWINVINILIVIRKKNFIGLLVVISILLGFSMIYFLGKQAIAIALFLVAYNLFFENKSNQNILYILPSVLIILMMLMGITNFHEPSLLEQKVQHSIQKMYYGSNEDFLLPDGQFTLLESTKRMPKETFEVILSSNDPYYLRGYIASTYDGHSFLPEQYHSKEEIEYLKRLQRNGFQPKTQLAEASKETKINQMQVKNVGASRKYKYIPYELIDEDINQGNDKYQLSVNTYQLDNLNEILERVKESPQSKYLKQESYYNRYVYEKYRQMPKASENYLKGILKEESQRKNPPKDHPDVDMIKQKVIDFFDQNLTYQPKFSRFYGDGDFLEFVIERQAGGIDVHYASLATMLFRYYGIPARYVEGFLITPTDLDGMVDGQSILLNGSHAHAWVEVYEDGLGWVPFEVSPPYYSTMPQASQLVAKSSQSYEEPIVLPDEASKILEEENYHRDQKKLQERQVFINRIAILLGAFTLVLLVILLVIAFSEVHYHRKLNRLFYLKAKKSNNRISTLALGERIIWLINEQDRMAFDPYRRFEVKEKWQSIYSEARFSEHEISKEQQGILVERFEKNLELFEQSLNKFRWIKMKAFGYLKRF